MYPLTRKYTLKFLENVRSLCPWSIFELSKKPTQNGLCVHFLFKVRLNSNCTLLISEGKGTNRIISFIDT